MFSPIGAVMSRTSSQRASATASPPSPSLSVLPAKMDAFSLSVPAELPYPRTTVDAGARRKWNENYLIIDYWCPNGTHFVFVVFFDPFWP